jgi:hypothetical protein
MPCDTRLKYRQTLSERKAEVKKRAENIDKLLTRKKVVPKVSPQGAVAFTGLSNEDRDGLTDGCIYRRIMSTGSAMAKAEIARAEALAGRSIDKNLVAQGVHSHDGGETWHGKD